MVALQLPELAGCQRPGRPKLAALAVVHVLALSQPPTSSRVTQQQPVAWAIVLVPSLSSVATSSYQHAALFASLQLQSPWGVHACTQARMAGVSAVHTLRRGTRSRVAVHAHCLRGNSMAWQLAFCCPPPPCCSVWFGLACAFEKGFPKL